MVDDKGGFLSEVCGVFPPLKLSRLLPLASCLLPLLWAGAQEAPPAPVASPTAALIEKAGSAGRDPQTPASVSAATPPPIMGQPTPADTKVETIIFIRHGEKTNPDIGQLSPQGLNRALALPFVLEKKFGRPDYLYAPATTKKTESKGKEYSYVRPLATIEPTAIRLGMTVDTKYAFDQIAAFQQELCDPANREAKIFVVWEHHLLGDLVRRIVTSFGGDAQEVGDWGKDDYDSIFIVKLRTEPGGKRSVAFERDKEGLDGLSTAYPEIRLP